MTGAPEQLETAAEVVQPASQVKNASKGAPTSPAPSDKSSDSEGRPVREKLKDTRIDAQATSDPISTSDQLTNDVSNGTTSARDQSTSGSDSERGRLRRKRSREDFEEEHEADKQPEKKVGSAHDRHARKKSRDVTKDTDAGVATKSAPGTVSRIEESDVEMTSPNKPRSTSAKIGAETSPKNKRTRDQIERETEINGEQSKGATTNGKPLEIGGDERGSKRLRDQDETNPATETVEPKSKTSFGSGFANTSASSPFAAMSPKPHASKTSDKAESLPQTSNDKFKSSGFGGFASSVVSPFSGLSGPKSGSSSPFGAASGNKLPSFAGSAALPTSTGSAFSTLATSTKSAFGGSSFGGSLGGGFASLAGSKSGVSSFGTPGTLEITGLKSKTAKPFGAAANNEVSDEEDGDDSGTEGDGPGEERRSSQPLLSQQPHETGEEGETTVWTGRTKLYTMAGEPDARAWKERGRGTFKVNLTIDEPKKARFVLRADGTHRLLLNAAVTKNMVFGGDAQGEKPKDGKLLFNELTGDGVVEMHLLKLSVENAIKLWEEVSTVQEKEL